MNTMLNLSVVVYRYLILAIDVILFFLKVHLLILNVIYIFLQKKERSL